MDGGRVASRPTRHHRQDDLAEWRSIRRDRRHQQGTSIRRSSCETPEVWTAFQIDPNTADQAHYFRSAGRLKPGVTLAQAQSKFQQSATAFRDEIPDAHRPERRGSASSRSRRYSFETRTSLLAVLLAAVAGVLLIACANVANLLLVRSTVRKREMAIRAAMGADRGRIIRQLMTESVLLSVIGGAIGLAFGLVGIRSLLSINTADLPRVGEEGSAVQLDWRLVAFTAAVSIGTGLLFGLVPAIHSARDEPRRYAERRHGSVGRWAEQRFARASWCSRSRSRSSW